MSVSKPAEPWNATVCGDKRQSVTMRLLGRALIQSEWVLMRRRDGDKETTTGSLRAAISKAR